MGALVWSVKISLLQYVGNLPDGDIRFDGVSVQEDGFHFPADPAHPGRYRGSISVTAHGGLLNLAVADPALENEDAVVTVAVDNGERIPFASVTGWDSAGGRRTAMSTRLTEQGAKFIGNAYPAGTVLDDLTVI